LARDEIQKARCILFSAMRTTSLFAIFGLLSLCLVGGLLGQTSLQPSPIVGTCQSGGNPAYPNCIAGEVTFNGSSVNQSVHVTVTNSQGTVVDNSDYGTTGGNFSFTENFSIADTYSIAVDGTTLLSVTTN